MSTQFAKYKDELLKEQAKLIEAMQTMGQLSDIVPGDWETYTDPAGNKELEPDALADKYEEETTNEGVLETLEERLREVTDALERIANGTYGICMITGKQIEPEILNANPAATTCLLARKSIPEIDL
jgi:RNA polymerase-binding transcription factor DksA